MNFLEKFKLKNEKEDFKTVHLIIDNGIEFKGTNLWILVFAIFIASLGLNVNSTAVIIGAMLVSPLMGPIMGLGFGMAVNDLRMLKKSFTSYLFAAGVGLATSTTYFFLTPLNEAHSEILARTSPNIYDVLIALFGGLAGMIATSSRVKGNVIAGVAIATALMPPLCTAGYGLATLKLNYFFGAFYLFLINSVFIALATLITTRLLKFPFIHLPKREDEIKANRIVLAIVIVTVLPSIYFGYNIVQENKFNQNVENFINFEATFPNDYLLKKNVDAKKNIITLTFGGATISEPQIELLRSNLKKYNLSETKLEVRQGFAYLQDAQDKQANLLSLTLNQKEKEIQKLQSKLDSINKQQELSNRVYNELKAQYDNIQSLSIQQVLNITDTLQENIWLALISSRPPLKKEEKNKIENWLKVRVDAENIKVKFEE